MLVFKTQPARHNRVRLRAILFLLLFAGAGGVRADWRDDLSSPEPGDFPLLRPVKLEYQCGWAGLTAGSVEALFSRPSAALCELDAKASTTGLARALWKLDATHLARADAATLRPIEVRQREIYRSQTVQTNLDFDGTGVDQLRESTTDKNPARTKHYDFHDLRDLATALLYVRSQKLHDGDVYHLVVYPASAPYLATITVLSHEKLKVKVGTYSTIKIDLKLERITKEMTLIPHGKFKHATGWLSDDDDRIPLRLNAQIFVGSVWLELTKMTPTQSSPAPAQGLDQ